MYTVLNVYMQGACFLVSPIHTYNTIMNSITAHPKLSDLRRLYPSGNHQDPKSEQDNQINQV